MCFHSINIPSEWGLEVTRDKDGVIKSVSIQLISPASGDGTEMLPDWEAVKFPFN
jgi:hypothetical protein